MVKAELKYNILYVKDVISSMEFYEKVFGLERIFVTEEKDYGELNTGNTTLSFASEQLGNSSLKNGFILSESVSKPFGIELVFVTEDIEQTWKQAIEAGATILEPIVTKPWGQQVGYLRDPNGFLLEIATPISK